MATINFLYRSIKEKSNLTLRLLFRNNSIDHVLDAKINFEVTKLYWTKQHKLQRVKDIDILNKQSEVNSHLSDLSNFVLTAYNSVRKDEIEKVVNKDWLETVLNNFYYPPSTTDELQQLNIPL